MKKAITSRLEKAIVLSIVVLFIGCGSLLAQEANKQTPSASDESQAKKYFH